jgi:hypothetical protein
MSGVPEYPFRERYPELQQFFGDVYKQKVGMGMSPANATKAATAATKELGRGRNRQLGRPMSKSRSRSKSRSKSRSPKAVAPTAAEKAAAEAARKANLKKFYSREAMEARYAAALAKNPELAKNPSGHVQGGRRTRRRQ